MHPKIKMILMIPIAFYVCSIATMSTALEINVEPSIFGIGITRRLHVKCSLTREESSSMGILFSILISHSRKADQPEFQYLASVNSFDGKVNGVVLNTTTASGVIDNKGESFLELTWEYPSEVRAGVYKCEASGINVIGKPLTTWKSAAVSSTRPDVNTLVRELQNITKYVDLMNEELNELQQVAEAQASVQKNSLHQALHSLFYVSSAFNGGRYYLSRNAAAFSQASVQEICKMYGGHLAEIETNEEFSFVRGFIAGRNVFHVIVTGGSDEAQEGNWTNIYKNTPLKVFNWYRGEPNGGRTENCQGFWRGGNWHMADMICTWESLNNEAGYICEIPV